MKFLFIHDTLGFGLAKWEHYAVRSMDDNPQILITLTPPIITEAGVMRTFVCNTRDKDKFLFYMPDDVFERLIV